ncbi:MAG: hypothetical protein VYC62_01325 [Verrucomicrobiota bacterium]|nr:hypothetical protein [Verrucomicrobiota bacterium]
MHHNITSLFSPQQEIPILLAESVAQLIFYLVIGLIYAFVAWYKKQKAAESQNRAKLNTPSSVATPPLINSTSQSSGGWMDKLEQMVEEAELESFNDETEYNTPRLHGEYYDNLPPVLSDQSEIINTDTEQEPVFSDVTIDDKVQETKNVNPSPVYESPIYNSNIAREIANDINVARQGVISAIILNPPRSLEDPDKITRY